MSDMGNAYNHLRRFWSGNLNQKQLAAELGVSIALANKFAKHNRPDDLPKLTDLPAGIDDIINETDFSISVRGHHTKCWLWKKNRTRIKDPVSGRNKEITEVIYRIYSGDDVPGGKALLHKCGQDLCINYEHFCLIRKREVDVIHQIRTRSDVELREGQLNIIRKLAKRYNWTEKEQTLIFNITGLDLKD